MGISVAGPASAQSTRSAGPSAAVESYSTARLWVSPPSTVGLIPWGLGIRGRHHGSVSRSLLAHGVLRLDPPFEGRALLIASLEAALLRARQEVLR